MHVQHEIAQHFQFIYPTFIEQKYMYKRQHKDCCGTKLYNSYTGCFTMNDTKVFVNLSGYNASSDLKHVAKC